MQVAFAVCMGGCALTSSSEKGDPGDGLAMVNMMQPAATVVLLKTLARTPGKTHMGRVEAEGDSHGHGLAMVKMVQQAVDLIQFVAPVVPHGRRSHRQGCGRKLGRGATE